MFSFVIRVLLTCNSIWSSFLDQFNTLALDQHHPFSDEDPLFIEFMQSPYILEFSEDVGFLIVNKEDGDAGMPMIICELVKLNGLIMKNCDLNSLPYEFAKLQHLRSLDLSHNRFDEIPQVIFSIISLESLYLNFNSLGKISDSILKLKNLQCFDISNCLLNKIDISFSELPLLTQLNISDNPGLFGLSTNPYSKTENKILNEMFTNNSIESLYIAGNTLKILPDNIIFIKLIDLRISENLLEALPDDMNNFKAVQILRLNRNNFTEIPKSLIQLVNLKELYMNKNKIKGIITFKQNELVNLKILDLSHNTIRTIKISKNTFEYLVILDLKVNNMRYLDKNIHRIKSLKKIDLRNNAMMRLNGNFPLTNNLVIRVTVIDILYTKELFLNQNIKKLYINCYRSSIMEKYLFNNVVNDSKLKVLELDACYLHSIPKNISNLKNLVEISLENNFLTIVNKSFNGLTKLEVLNLKKNNIIYIDGSIFLLEKLIFLDISNNDLCYLPKEINYMNDNLLINLDNNSLYIRSDPVSLKNGEIGILDISYKLVRNIMISRECLAASFTDDATYYYLISNNDEIQWNIYKISKAISTEPDQHLYDAEFMLNAFNNNFKQYIDDENMANTIIEYIKNVYEIKRHPIHIVANIPDKERSILKNYLEAIFISLLKLMEDNIEIINLAFYTILPGMSVCVDGQINHLREAYYTLTTKQNFINIENFVRNFIAKYKVDVLRNITTSNMIDENIYYFIYWENNLANELGFIKTNNLYSANLDNIFLTCKEYILHHFFKEFSVENVVLKMYNMINKNGMLISLASHYIYTHVYSNDELQEYLIFEDIEMMDFEGIKRKGVYYILKRMKFI